MVELETDFHVHVDWDKELTSLGYVRCAIVNCQQRCFIAAPELNYFPVCWEHVVVTRVPTK